MSRNKITIFTVIKKIFLVVELIKVVIKFIDLIKEEDPCFIINNKDIYYAYCLLRQYTKELKDED